MNETLEEVAKAASNANKTFAEQTTSFVNWIKNFITWDNIFKAVGAIILIFIMLDEIELFVEHIIILRQRVVQ